MRRAHAVGVVLLLALGGCQTAKPSSDEAPDSDRDQPGVAQICLSGSDGDVKDFRSILSDLNIEDVPLCSGGVKTDIVANVTRAVNDKTGEYRVRIILHGKSEDGTRVHLDLSSTGRKKKGECVDEVFHRLIAHDRDRYIAKIGTLH